VVIDSAPMAGLGIVQRGDSALERPALSVALPDETAYLASVIGRLHEVAAAARKQHPFVGGMGLAAPQIGIGRAVAIVQDPSGDRFVTLVNPMITAAWEVTVEFEGCLSFFDVRGAVPRANNVKVSYQAPTGQWRSETFHGRLARLVEHEIDHLRGRLYPDRMAPGAPLLPVAEYRLHRCVKLSG
jgi:peptide deformylase